MNNFRVVLIICFLLFAVIPLSVMQFYSAKVLEDSTYENTMTKLQGLADHKVHFVESEFVHKQVKLKAFAKKDVIINAMDEYNQAFEIGLDQQGYKAVEEKYFKYFEQYLSLDNDYDLFLINTKGDIVFTVAKEGDLGSNLYTGPYKESALADAYKKVLKEYDVVLSNIEIYEASEDLHSLFIATPIFKDNQLVGVLATQVDNKIINTIAKNYIGLGHSGEAVFVKKQGDYAVVMNEMRYLADPAFTRFIHQDIEGGRIYHAALNGERAFALDYDMEGNEVFAYWQQVKNTDWAIVVKINADEVLSHMDKQRNALLFSFLVIFILVTLVGYYLAKLIASPIRDVAISAKQAAAGDFNVQFKSSKWKEVEVLSSSLQSMLDKIENTVGSLNHDLWLRDSVSKLATFINTNEGEDDKFEKFLSLLSKNLNASAGVFYDYQDACYSTVAYFGGVNGQRMEEHFNHNNDIFYQIAKEKEIIWLKNYDASLIIKTALNTLKSSTTVLFPVTNGNDLVGVIELAWVGSEHDSTESLLTMLNETLAMSIVASQQKLLVKDMLDQTLDQAEELKNQKISLESTNDELQQKSEMLKTTMQEIEEKSKEVERASQYKSEFLANMSHELRTPLNSMLILANSLAENDEGNLNQEEVESAEVVYESGKHLLSLINDILDLSKVESGKMELSEVDTSIYDMVRILTTRFKHMAEQKGLQFNCHITDSVPNYLLLDDVKLSQILTNLIGNAIKFTDKGEIRLTINIRGSDKITFAVTDNGIGIAEEKIETVFSAFQQADSSTSRSYGGTGLGLSIVKQYTDLMGGDVTVESELGVGSTFTVVLPLNKVSARDDESDITPDIINRFTDSNTSMEDVYPLIIDDKNNLDMDKPTILIVENDPVFAKILLDVCHHNDCNGIVELSGENLESVINTYHFDAVISDYMLPKINGAQVINILKNNPRSSNVPIHIISALDDLTHTQTVGSVGRSVKPINIKELNKIVFDLLNECHADKSLLIIEDNDLTYKTINAAILSQEKNVVLTRARSGAEAKDCLFAKQFSCIIVDLGLPDCFGGQLLSDLQPIFEEYNPKIIIYSAGTISGEVEEKLHVFTDTIITKSGVNLNELLDAVHKFVSEVPDNGILKAHQNDHLVADNPDNENGDEGAIIEAVDEPVILPVQESIPNIEPAAVEVIDESSVDGSVKILLVDDQMKNIFALAKVLRKKDFHVEIAPSGKDAIEKIESHGDFDVVLMDIMMPEMDGYEATKIIRDNKRFVDLPIIAVTAKAMAGDREKCLEAGMNDYIAKPVDIDLLIATVDQLLER